MSCVNKQYHCAQGNDQTSSHLSSPTPQSRMRPRKRIKARWMAESTSVHVGFSGLLAFLSVFKMRASPLCGLQSPQPCYLAQSEDNCSCSRGRKEFQRQPEKGNWILWVISAQLLAAPINTYMTIDYRPQRPKYQN